MPVTPIALLLIVAVREPLPLLLFMSRAAAWEPRKVLLRMFIVVAPLHHLRVSRRRRP